MIPEGLAAIVSRHDSGGRECRDQAKRAMCWSNFGSCAPSSLISWTQSAPFGGRSTSRQVAKGMKSGVRGYFLRAAFLPADFRAAPFRLAVFLPVALRLVLGRGRSPLSPWLDLTLVFARFL
jgi:hypothetical protein